MTYGCDSPSYQHVGNLTGSDGTSYVRRVGNMTYGSDGTSYERISNVTSTRTAQVMSTFAT